jgi:hypothetical protein
VCVFVCVIERKREFECVFVCEIGKGERRKIHNRFIQHIDGLEPK